MRKIFICVYLSVFSIILCSCGKENESQSSKSNYFTEKTITTEDIYKSTGCRALNPQTIVFMNEVFIDSKGFRYLYGARKTETGKMFWVSKYTNEGNLLWETNASYTNEDSSRAFLAKELKNGNILVACIIDIDDRESKTMIPTIISSSDGTTTFVKVKEQYFYSYVNVYENSFICGIDNTELLANLKATKWFSHISNDGKIIQSKPEMVIPYGTTIWKDDTNFISANDTVITRGNTAESLSLWKLKIGLDMYNSYKVNLSMVNDTVLVKYALNAEEKKAVYKILYSTGELVGTNNLEDSEFKFSSLGREYLAPNNMNVIMDSIKITDYNQGYTYYTINYTLKNKTKSDVIAEGSFDIYYSGFRKGETQYGIFYKLYPGESISSSYTFKVLSDIPVTFVQYKHKWDESDAQILKNSLKWKMPSK